MGNDSLGGFMGEKAFSVVIVLMLIAILVIGVKVASIENMLVDGKHLVGARVSYVMSADHPWEKLPTFMKENIALSDPRTKLSKEDLIDIRNDYQRMIDIYTEPVVAFGKGYKNKKGRE